VFFGGMWGSNPRHAPPKIRFRNLLYFRRLTNQFTIIFAPIWDNFGTLFEILGKGSISTYLSEFQYVISVADNSGKGFWERYFAVRAFQLVSQHVSKSFAKVQNISDIRKHFHYFLRFVSDFLLKNHIIF